MYVWLCLENVLCATKLYLFQIFLLSLDFSVTFKDPHNQHVVNTLIQEVKALNPSFLTQHIRGMVVTHAHTLIRTFVT